MAITHTFTPAKTRPQQPVQQQQNPFQGKPTGMMDTVWRWAARGAAAFIVAIVVLIGAFLALRTAGALPNNTVNFFTYAGRWDTSDTSAMAFGIWNLLWVTVVVSLLALLLATPIAISVALLLTQYVPKRLARPLGFIMDMLAAIPSIVFGLWAVRELGPKLGPIYEFCAQHLGGLFFFATYENSPGFATSRNLATGAIVLAIMILPIIAATCREVFATTPHGLIEGAAALGSTKWEQIRMVVLPLGRSGIICAVMLGLGRALGETMALYLVLSPSSEFRASLFDGGTTFATAIANAAAEFNDDIKAGAYIAAGLALFVLTFVVNAIARKVATTKI